MRAKHDPELIHRFAELLSLDIPIPAICERLCIGKGHGYRLFDQIRSRLGWQAV